MVSKVGKIISAVVLVIALAFIVSIESIELNLYTFLFIVVMLILFASSAYMYTFFDKEEKYWKSIEDRRVQRFNQNQ